MEERGESVSVLATLADGSSIMSVVIDDAPLPRHIYRVIGPDGDVISEKGSLGDLTDFLAAYEPDGDEPSGNTVPHATG